MRRTAAALVGYLSLAVAAQAAPAGAHFRAFTIHSDVVRHRVLYSFQSGQDGSGPTSTLIAGPDGSLYGTTSAGGGSSACVSLERPPGCGTVYKLTRTARGFRETVLYAFQNGADGAFPYSSLVIDASGALYGTASEGGSAGAGVVFRLTPNGPGYAFSVIHNFALTKRDGVAPMAGVVADGSGSLYGTASFGGVGGCGIVFRLTPEGSQYKETVLHGFNGCDGTSGGYGFSRRNDGGDPEAPVFVAVDGTIYGTTQLGGGLLARGIVFKLTPTPRGFRETILHRFRDPSGGLVPSDGVFVDASGAIFGTTSEGGNPSCGVSSYGCGVVYKIANAQETVMHAFSGPDGAYPQGIVRTPRGDFVGTTSGGGQISACPQGCGTVFSLKPNGSGYAESVIYAFAGGSDGSGPTGVIDIAGTLYGTTFAGGLDACNGQYCGTVFSVRR